MASKKRKYRQKWDFDDYEDLDFTYEDDLEISDIAKDFYSADSRYDSEEETRITARHQIERRKDMKKLYSELNDWEMYGDQDDWR
jgi:hypothetical protein